MYKNKKILALIPARGGSKGIPRKNIKPLLGKPLIAWTIEQGKRSKYIDRIIISTEDEEIAEISKKYGAQAPFLRPKELATDETKGIDVVLHTIEWMKRNNESFDLIMLLQPVSPLRTSEDIDKAVELLFSKNAMAIISVCEVDHHPYWVNRLPENGCMENFLKPEVMNKGRQELTTFYRLNGAIYLAYCDYIAKQKGFFGNESFAYIMPKERSVDIDDEMDFILAEFLMKNKFSCMKNRGETD